MKVTKNRGWFSPLDWLGKVIAFIFTTKKLYFGWGYVLVPAFLLLMFSGYTAYEYPDYFFTALLYDPIELPDIVSVYYISCIIVLILIVVALFGRLAFYFSLKTEAAKKELNDTMQELADSYLELNKSIKELNELKGM